MLGIKAFILMVWIVGSGPVQVSTYSNHAECHTAGALWLLATEKQIVTRNGGYACLPVAL